MIKKFTLSLSICLMSILTFAQQADQVLARVRYSFIHQRDTTQKNNPYTENMLLLLGKNASLFTSYDKINREIATIKANEQYIKSQAGGAPITLRTNSEPFKPVTQIDLLFFAKERQFITKDRVIEHYLIVEDIPKINWKLAKDTASFSGILCNKATAYFKGRNWIAWYALSLPFPNGPWKLNGLPGLIVEAYDEKKEAQFKFAGFEELKKENVDETNFYLGAQIKLHSGAQKTTRKDFDKLKEAFDKDPQGFHAAASGLPRNRIFAGRSMTGVVHNVINNPLELPEGKK